MHPITKYYREMRDRLVEKEEQKRLLEEMMQADEKDGLYEMTFLESTNTDTSMPELINTPAHYDNSKGSLYKFAEDHKLNAYEFDAIKRIVRCRKKGQFLEDIDKTIEVLKLYKKEYGS